MTRPALRLFDGPLAWLDRDQLVQQMADHLVEFDAYHNEHDARLSLRFKGYKATDVMMLIDDARQAAMQIVVAREMSKP